MSKIVSIRGILLLFLITLLNAGTAYAQAFQDPAYKVGLADITAGKPIPITVSLVKKSSGDQITNSLAINPQTGLQFLGTDCVKGKVGPCSVQLNYSRTNPVVGPQLISFRFLLNGTTLPFPRLANTPLTFSINWQAPSLKIEDNSIIIDNISPLPPSDPSEAQDIEIKYTLENDGPLPVTLDPITAPVNLNLIRGANSGGNSESLGNLNIVPSDGRDDDKSTCLNGSPVPPLRGPLASTCTLTVDYKRPSKPTLDYKEMIKGYFQIKLKNQNWPVADVDRFQFTLNVASEVYPIVLAVGSAGTIVKSSSKGITADWTLITDVAASTEMLTGIAQSDQGSKPIVIVGADIETQQGVIYLNEDGTGNNWRNVTMPDMLGLNAVAYGPDPELFNNEKVFMAVGRSGAVWRSTNGSTWIKVTNMPTISATIMALAVDNITGQWLAVVQNLNSFDYLNKTLNQEGGRWVLSRYGMGSDTYTPLSVASNGSVWVLSVINGNRWFNSPFVYTLKMDGSLMESRPYKFSSNAAKGPEPLMAVACDKESKLCLLVGRYGTSVALDQNGQLAVASYDTRRWTESFWAVTVYEKKWLVAGTGGTVFIAKSGLSSFPIEWVPIASPAVIGAADIRSVLVIA